MKMGFTEEVYLSFAIFIFVCLYLFLVVLESPWSNNAAAAAYWLPQDCIFPSAAPEIMASVIDSNVADMHERTNSLW